MDLPITLSRCPVFTNGEIDTDRPIPVVPESHDFALTEKQLVDYRDRRVGWRPVAGLSTHDVPGVEREDVM